MVAVTRDSDSGLVTGLDDGGTILNLDLDVVDGDLHLCSSNGGGVE
jgi:hypothetical protein